MFEMLLGGGLMFVGVLLGAMIAMTKKEDRRAP